MTITAIDPWFVFIPVTGLAFAALAIGLWQCFTARIDWTLIVPAGALACSLLVLLGFANELASGPKEFYVRLSDVTQLQESTTHGNTGTPSAYSSLSASAYSSFFSEREHYNQSSPYPRTALAVRPKVNSSPTSSITTVRDADEPSRPTWYALFLLTFAAPALVVTTLLHVAPGPRFDIVRRSLRVQQVVAPIGAELRGSRELGPHAVPSHPREKTAMRQNATDQNEHFEQEPGSTLRELEIEFAKTKGQLRTLSKDEIAEMKRPLYDHFDPK